MMLPYDILLVKKVSNNENPDHCINKLCYQNQDVSIITRTVVIDLVILLHVIINCFLEITSLALEIHSIDNVEL